MRFNQQRMSMVCGFLHFTTKKQGYPVCATLQWMHLQLKNFHSQLNSALFHPQKQIQEYQSKLSVRNTGWTERQCICTKNCPSKQMLGYAVIYIAFL